MYFPSIGVVYLIPFTLSTVDDPASRRLESHTPDDLPSPKPVSIREQQLPFILVPSILSQG